MRGLTHRERRIYMARKLTEPRIKLQVLAAEFQLSQERVRQIEQAAAHLVESRLRQPIPDLPKRSARPAESWLNYQQRVKFYEDLGFTAETATAYAKDRRYDAALGLPGAADDYFCRAPGSGWRRFLELPSAIRMREASR